MREREKLYILCGLSNEGSEDIRSALVDAARDQGYEAVCVSRYRKEGIRQYISEHQEFRLLVLQEAMQNSYPYTAEELAELMDDYNLNIVISINKSHRANTYMKVLYTAGILNALYEEDATADNILKRILYPRTRKECRAYYQIASAADAMRTLEVIDEGKMQGYLSYLEESQDDEEIQNKFKYIANSLKLVENMYLIKLFSTRVQNALAEDDSYQHMLALQQKKKGHWPFGKKRSFEKEWAVTGRMEREIVPQRPMEVTGKIEVVDDSVKEMIDEDISDLLVFGNFERESEFHTEMLGTLENSEEKKDRLYELQEECKKNEKGRNYKYILIKGLLVISVLGFLTVVILFGFFLYSEHQKKESSMPVISSQPDKTLIPESEQKEKQQEFEIKETAVDKKRQDMQQKTKDKNQNSKEVALNSGGDVQHQAEMQFQPAVQNSPIEITQPTGSAGDSFHEVQQQSVVEFTGTTENITIDEDNPEQSQSVVSCTSYQGKILTGREVAMIAAEEETKGISLYLKTREAGEGVFSADVIARMVDDTCSYLAQGVTDGRLTFIQQ